MLTRELRNDAFKIYLLIRERNMPSNCTIERLVQRSGLPLNRVTAAVALLWADDTGWLREDIDRSSGQQGFWVLPQCRDKTPPDLESLTPSIPDDEDAEDDEDADDDADADDEWSETDHADDDDN